MKKLFVVIIVILILLSVRKKLKYEDVFGDSYREAIEFLNENDSIINKYLGYDKQCKNEKLAIVFPELIKYTLYQDLLETTALELIYTNYGKDYADFSIGYFQMKPSFIENIETETLKYSELKSRYYKLLTYDNLTVKEIRKVRVKRLKTLEWQLIYLNCFYDYLTLIYQSEKWKNQNQKVKFYATAYNYNFKADKKDIENRINRRLFPYGKQKGNKQYSYCEISVYYINNRTNF